MQRAQRDQMRKSVETRQFQFKNVQPILTQPVEIQVLLVRQITSAANLRVVRSVFRLHQFQQLVPLVIFLENTRKILL